MRQIIVSIIIIVYLAVGGFGFVHTFQMSNHEHMGALPCPFMPGTQTVCLMNATEHIALWKSMMTTTLPKFSIVSIRILLAALFFGVYRPPRFLRRLPFFHRKIYDVFLLYRELFSQGVLNSKAP